MNIVAALLRELIAAGLEGEALIAAVDRFASATDAGPKRSVGAIRQERYRRNKASQIVTSDDCYAGDVTAGALSKTKAPPTPPLKTQPISEPPSPPTGAHGSVTTCFSEFWSAYPRKEAKPKARAAYDRALKRIGGPDPPTGILTALARAKLCRQWCEGIIPHPATWLNRDPWDDEPSQNERPNHPNSPSSSPDARRTNTESRRGVWAELIAERDSVSAQPNAGPGTDRDGEGGVPGYPRLAFAGDSG